MQVESLSWFPGHMTKTRRMIAAEIGHMDAVCEILDARIPLASRNPDVDELTAGKPRLVVLNRVDQADPGQTRRWAAYFREKGYAVLEANAKGGAGTAQFAAAVRELLRDKLEAYAQKGQVGRVVRVMVLGIPNVGKSTFINKVARRKTAKAEDRPGVTRSKQWVPVDSTLELLDTPGILWPKFDDPEVGKRLAFTGAIKDDVLDIEELACYLMEYLGRHYTSVLEERYKIAVEPEDSGYDLLEKAGRKRGFLMRGAQVDTERMARILLDEFRGGKLGRFTLRELEDVCDHVGIMNQGKVLLERSLSELQDTTVKLQVVYPGEEPRLPAELHILHHSAVGRVHTYILRGDRESILNRMQITAPLLLEAIPLTLEEIFIYELGGADYAVRDIVL